MSYSYYTMLTTICQTADASCDSQSLLAELSEQDAFDLYCLAREVRKKELLLQQAAAPQSSSFLSQS